MKHNNNNNQPFYWYSLRVKKIDIDLTIDKIKKLSTKRIKNIINPAEIINFNKQKLCILFIQLNITKKLINAIVSIPNVLSFLPNNTKPYICNDIKEFLKYHNNVSINKDNQQKKEQYLNEHESKIINFNFEKINKINQTKNNDDNDDYDNDNTHIDDNNVELSKYNVGDMVLINKGIFKDKYAIILAIDKENLNLKITMQKNQLNITTNMHYSDTELIKDN